MDHRVSVAAPFHVNRVKSIGEQEAGAVCPFLLLAEDLRVIFVFLLLLQTSSSRKRWDFRLDASAVLMLTTRNVLKTKRLQATTNFNLVSF